MNLREEFKRIDKFFENMSIEEFDNMLIRNGIENSRYQIDPNVTFYYKRYEGYEALIARVKKQQDEYNKVINNRCLINSYENINLEAV